MSPRRDDHDDRRTGTYGYSGDGGPATSARLYNPYGVAVDGQGSVYIADHLNQRVRMVSPGGTITTIAGTGRAGFSGDGGLATSASLSRPHGVAVDGQGNVYIADIVRQPRRKIGKAAGTTSPGKSPVSSRCSKATALVVAERFRFAAPDAGDSVARVLCGPFACPGSRAMAVAITPGTCGINGWAVFNFTGGAWRLVGSLHPGWVMDIAAVGSAIRETAPIPTGQFRCPTSNPPRTRIWRWNGSRLVAGPWKQGATPTPSAPPGAEKSHYFKSPSGNIVCGYRDGINTQASVACRIKSGLKPPPPTERPGCVSRGEVFLRATGRVQIGRSICPGEDEGDAGVLAFESVAQVLAYGATWSGDGVRCTSAVTGLTCRNQSGHGFFLSRESWRAF